MRTRLPVLEGSAKTRNFFYKIALWIVHRPTYLSLILCIVTTLVVGLINPDYWQLANLFDVLRSATVLGLFAIGVMLVLAAGGLDVSFTAIAALVMYSLTLLVLKYFPGISMAPILLLGIVFGAVIGSINGLLVNALKAPSLIVTIGTQYVIRGFLLTFIGTSLFMNIPKSMDEFGQINIVSLRDSNGFIVSLPAYVLILLAVAIATSWLLHSTLMGRAIFATGGAPDVAERLGFNVRKVRVFVFAYAGGLAGLAGLLHVSSNRLANPFDLAGTELQVIAAVVLGGASISGGTGSVLGTLFGALLITQINGVLIMVGIPSSWQMAVIGAFIILAGVIFSIKPKSFPI